MSAFYSDPAGRYYRLLWQEQETAYLINCTGTKAPIQVSKEVLNTLVPSSSPLLFQDENFLSARQKRIRDERFAQLKDLVQEIPALLQPAERKKRLMECAEQAGVSVRTLAGRLFQYWVYQTPNILVPKPTKPHCNGPLFHSYIQNFTDGIEWHQSIAQRWIHRFLICEKYDAGRDFPFE